MLSTSNESIVDVIKSSLKAHLRPIKLMCNLYRYFIVSNYIIQSTTNVV